MKDKREFIEEQDDELVLEKEEKEEGKEKEFKSPYDASKIEQLLTNSLRYKDQLNLPKKWAENENFKLGDQWAPPTEKTKNFPRPVLNFCSYIVDHKTASILSENVRMVFTSQGNQELGDDFTNFAEREYERMKIDDLNSKILDDSAVKGVGISYFYIQPSVDGIVKLQGEQIDPVNFHCSNPKENNVQKQAWNIVVQRLPLQDVLDMAEVNGVKVDLSADKEVLGSEYANKDVDIDGIEKVNLINFFYRDRNSGKIHLIKTVANQIVVPDIDLGINRYPFAVMQWANKTEDFYSKAELDFIKANQRQVNTLMGLQLMNIQLSGFPKMWSKKGALNPKSVKGNIGEILIDNSQSNGLNFGWLQPAPLDNFATVLQDNLINHTKALNGAHDSDTGAAKADNATAIMLLQKQSATALGKLKKKFYQYIEDIANIWLEFFCNYYIIDREYTFINNFGIEETKIFNAGTTDIDALNVKVDVGVSSQWSEEFTLNSLDKFLQMGLIDFKTYLKYIPANVVPFKESLLKEMQAREDQQAEEAKEYILSKLNPEELEIFNSLPEENQNKFLYEMAKNEEQLGIQEQQMAQM